MNRLHFAWAAIPCKLGAHLHTCNVAGCHLRSANGYRIASFDKLYAESDGMNFLSNAGFSYQGCNDA